MARLKKRVSYNMMCDVIVCFQQVITSIEAAKSAAQLSEGQARAKYTFNAQSSIELPFRKVS